MFNILIKLLVAKLHHLILLVALTGFVCTYKIQAEEQCLSSNVHCYECDSRYDPNCADPFELPSLSLADQQSLAAQASNNSSSPTTITNEQLQLQLQQRQQQLILGFNGTSSDNNGIQLMKVVKKMPPVAVCHGCCVKITSKTPEGAVFVKRTCTTNLQINYFMVGIVCMKESGDRGKMCFCETDYCNGQPLMSKPGDSLLFCLLIVALLLTTTNKLTR